MSRQVPADSRIIATAEGEAIPLDIASPKFCASVSLTSDFEPLVFPEDINLCTLFCTGAFQIIVNELVADIGVWTPGGFLGQSEIFYDLILPKTVFVKGSGTLSLNCLQKWASASNEGSYYNS